MDYHFVLAVTTYNRLHFLREFWAGFVNTRASVKWTVIVADDGSTDGSLAFLESRPELDILIYNDRRGVAEQTNSIFTILNGLDYNVCFKCDDDIIFLRPGWDLLYHEAIVATGYDHLCYDNPKFNVGSWCDGLVLAQPVMTINLIARVKPMAVKGCFWTITPQVLAKVGYMDSVNFFHGHEHTDFSMRCARAGFNDFRHPFDVIGSDDYISYRFPWKADQPCLTKAQFEANGNSQQELAVKKALLLSNRQFIDYTPCQRRMIC